MWLGTNRGLFKIGPDLKTIAHYQSQADNPQSLSGNLISDISPSPVETGVLWLATYDGGLNKFNIAAETFTSYRHDPNNKNSISADILRSIHQSPTGELWVRTLDKGLNKIEYCSKHFSHYYSQPDSRKG